MKRELLLVFGMVMLCAAPLQADTELSLAGWETNEFHPPDWEPTWSVRTRAKATEDEVLLWTDDYWLEDGWYSLLPETMRTQHLTHPVSNGYSNVTAVWRDVEVQAGETLHFDYQFWTSEPEAYEYYGIVAPEKAYVS